MPPYFGSLFRALVTFDLRSVSCFIGLFIEYLLLNFSSTKKDPMKRGRGQIMKRLLESADSDQMNHVRKILGYAKRQR